MSSLLRRRDAGYAMAAILVALAVIAVVVSMALPAWRMVLQREREEELVFRGRQYVRAVQLYQRKFANAYPPSIDVLVQQRFLRRKYKDPVNGDEDFEVVYQSALAQRIAQQNARSGITGSTSSGGLGQRGSASSGGLSMPGSAFGSQVAGPQGGVAGVASKSKAKSIRIYEGRTTYDQWPFVWASSSANPRMGMPAGPGGPGRGGLQPGTQGMPGSLPRR
jgi:type II secretory pathway pseudopilin PulG